MRTIPNIEHLLQPLEDCIRTVFLPILLEGHQCNDPKRLLLSLPPRYGGIGVFNPVTQCKVEYDNSRKVTLNGINNVKNQCEFTKKNNNMDSNLKNTIKNEKTKIYEANLEKGKQATANQSQLRSIETSTKNGAYKWLVALPIEKQGFCLDKRSFWDALHLRYNLPLTRLPEKCVCG